MWQYILVAISCLLFFGFVCYNTGKFGLQDCYSAYGPLWHEQNPKFNIWSLFTFITPLIMLPAILEASDGSIWQFTSFLCLAPMFFVALTPDYQHHGIQQVIHRVCAAISAVFSILFTALVAPQLAWFMLGYVIIATVCTFAFGKKNWMFWFEMAAYASLYTVLFFLI